MAKDIFSNVNLHGNTLTGAKVAAPTVAGHIANKKYVDDLFIEQGIDGFKEASFKVVDIVIKNTGITGSSICYMNKGWKIFVVTEIDLGNRSSYNMTSYLRFGPDENTYKDIAFTGQYNQQQAKFLYDISITNNQELFVLDTEDYITSGYDTTHIILDYLQFVNFTVQFQAKTITFKGQQVTHPAITLSETVMQHNITVDYYPVIAKIYNDFEYGLEDQDIQSADIPNTDVQCNISETINEVAISSSATYDLLIFTPQKYTNRRYWYLIIDDDGNSLSDKEPIVLNNLYQFSWLGTKYKQTVVNIGYLQLVGNAKIVIGFDII